jgi:ATP synthase (F/14-kDa) subunit
MSSLRLTHPRPTPSSRTLASHDRTCAGERMQPSRNNRAAGGADATYLIAVIGDEDTITGFLLAGVGQNDGVHDPNYFVVDPST